MGKVNITVLKKIPLFSTVSEQTLQLLSQNMRLVSYPKGSYIFHDREVVEQVYIVVSGKFNIYKLSETSEKRIIFILGMGNLLNDSLTDNLPTSINCESFEDSYVLVCPRSVFLKIMATDFELTQAVIQQYSGKLRRTYRQLKNAPTNIAIEKKLAAKIYSLSRDYGVQTPEGMVLDLQLSVVYLSQLLGAQRETVSRALKKLIEANLITYEQKKLTIKDIKSLGDYHKFKKL